MVQRLNFAMFAAVLLAIHPIFVCAETPLTQEQLAVFPWKLTPFLTGTTKQIRDAVNGALEEQLQRKSDKVQRIAVANADLQKQRDQAGVKLRAASPAFGKMQDGVLALRARQGVAKKNEDGAAEIKTQNDADALQEKVDAKEDAALKNDPSAISTRKQISDLQTELHNVESAISTSGRARDQLMDALRRSKKIPGPPAVGARGILAQVRPTKIIDANSFTTDFEAFEILGENKGTKTPDGMKSLSVKVHNLHLLVSGFDTAKLKIGKQITIDHNFIITGTQPAGKNVVYLVSPNADDKDSQAFDYLFDALDNVKGLSETKSLPEK